MKEIFVSTEGLKRLAEDLRPKYSDRRTPELTVHVTPPSQKLLVTLSDEDYQALLHKDVTDKYGV